MWTTVREFEDIRYETTDEGKIAKITINRPEVRNAFRPLTVKEMLQAFELAHEDPKVGAIILTGAGDMAFCSGGDQKVRGHAGYIGEDGIPRLNVLDLQKKIRSLPKPVVAMVAGYAIGGGHVLHILCDLTIAADNVCHGAAQTEECEKGGGKCVTDVDGYYTESFICCAFGFLWLGLWGWRTINRLQSAEESEWRVVKKSTNGPSRRNQKEDKERLL